MSFTFTPMTPSITSIAKVEPPPSDAEVAQQATLVSYLQAALRDYEAQIASLKKTLRTESNKLMTMCTHKAYRTEPNGDYHRPGVYYVCNTCKLIMTKKP